MVRAAARFGLTFRCSPTVFLDRGVQDVPALLAAMKAADDMLKEARSRG